MEPYVDQLFQQLKGRLQANEQTMSVQNEPDPDLKSYLAKIFNGIESVDRIAYIERIWPGFEEAALQRFRQGHQNRLDQLKANLALIRKEGSFADENLNRISVIELEQIIQRGIEVLPAHCAKGMSPRDQADYLYDLTGLSKASDRYRPTMTMDVIEDATIQALKEPQFMRFEERLRFVIPLLDLVSFYQLIVSLPLRAVSELTDIMTATQMQLFMMFKGDGSIYISMPKLSQALIHIDFQALNLLHEAVLQKHDSKLANKAGENTIDTLEENLSDFGPCIKSGMKNLKPSQLHTLLESIGEKRDSKAEIKNENPILKTFLTRLLSVKQLSDLIREYHDGSSIERQENLNLEELIRHCDSQQVEKLMASLHDNVLYQEVEDAVLRVFVRPTQPFDLE